MKIINELLKMESSVMELAKKVNMTQTAVSYQLRILRESRIVKYRKESPMIFYSIDDEHISEILELSKLHLEEKDE